MTPPRIYRPLAAGLLLVLAPLSGLAMLSANAPTTPAPLLQPQQQAILPIVVGMAARWAISRVASSVASGVVRNITAKGLQTTARRYWQTAVRLAERHDSNINLAVGAGKAAVNDTASGEDLALVDRTIAGMDARISREFAILGTQQMQRQHETVLAALAANQSSLLDIRTDIARLGDDLTAQINGLSLQLSDTLTRLESKVDIIDDKITAQEMKNFDAAVGILRDYHDDPGSYRQQLPQAAQQLKGIADYLGRRQTALSEEERLTLALSHYLQVVVQIALIGGAESETDRQVILRKVSEAFTTLAKLPDNSLLLSAAWSEIDGAGLNQDGGYTQTLLTNQGRQIAKKIGQGRLGDAQTMASSTALLVGDAAQPLVDEVDALLRCQAGSSYSDIPEHTQWCALQGWLAGEVGAIPPSRKLADYRIWLQRWQSPQLARAAVRSLLETRQYHDALSLLNDRNVNVDNDNFRVRSLLIATRGVDPPRFNELRQWVLDNPYYDNSLKNQARTM